MKRLVSYFLRGLLFLVPIGLSVWVVLGIFHALDDWGARLFNLPIPGIGIAMTLAGVTLVGFLASNFLTKRLLGGLEKAFDRLPLVKLLHGSIKDVLSAFVGDKRRFDRPVIVDLNGDGHVKALGFITRDNLEAYGENDAVAVYFPQAYNFAGQVVILPKSSVRMLDVPAGDVMTFIVSGGISGR